jgi:peptide/nickel transport system permease protein
VTVYVIRRMLYSVPVLIVSTFLSFTFVSLAGNPTIALRANPRFSQHTVDLLAARYHLQDPIVVRYAYWVRDVFTERLGRSLSTLQPIWPDLSRAMGHTAQVILISETFAITLGIAVGIYSALRQYSVFDYAFTGVSFLGFAMPTFWLALLLQILFVDIYLKWGVRILYTSGLNSPHEGTWSIDRLQHLALPALTLCIISFAGYSRFMRASMLEAISSDYVRTARAKGMGERTLILRHVVRNALIPIVTVAALTLAGQLGGAIITETVFTLDGMGYYFVQRLAANDVYAVMAYLLVTSLIIIVFNLIADVLYGVLDPRIRLG